MHHPAARARAKPVPGSAPFRTCDLDELRLGDSREAIVRADYPLGRGSARPPARTTTRCHAMGRQADPPRSVQPPPSAASAAPGGAGKGKAANQPKHDCSIPKQAASSRPRGLAFRERTGSGDGALRALESRPSNWCSRITSRCIVPPSPELAGSCYLIQVRSQSR